MSYVYGDVHTLTASGILSVSSPIGLSIRLMDIPSYVGGRTSSPTDLLRVARYCLGNVDGYMRSEPLEHVLNLVLAIPDGMDYLGVTLLPGMSAEITELLRPELSGMLGIAQLGALQLGRSAA